MAVPAGPFGVLLVNVGSPSAPTTAAVRRYLAEFLGDPGVIQVPRWIWMPVLHGLILPLRSRKSARLYAKVWTERGAPLIAISKAQGGALQRELGPDFRVAVGMRYGEPSIASALRELEGCRELLLVPMFPQYSGATTGSVEAAVRAELARSANPPALRVVTAFFDDPGYLAAVAARVRETVRDEEVDHYLFSLHGLPVRYVDAGDPYRIHSERTVAALVRELGLAPERWTLAYQSRFGREAWLEPYAFEVVPELARRAPRVAVVCPGFTADCLETLEEVHDQLGELFRRAGGREWTVVPCLNESGPWIGALGALVRRRAGAPSAGARG
jgi:protoporphyrin/coproporphyrin ferrochelatase